MQNICKKLQYFHNVLRLFGVLPNFLFTKVKRCAIIAYEHGICELHRELHRELPNDLDVGS